MDTEGTGAAFRGRSAWARLITTAALCAGVVGAAARSRRAPLGWPCCSGAPSFFRSARWPRCTPCSRSGRRLTRTANATLPSGSARLASRASSWPERVAHDCGHPHAAARGADRSEPADGCCHRGGPALADAGIRIPDRGRLRGPAGSGPPPRTGRGGVVACPAFLGSFLHAIGFVGHLVVPNTSRCRPAGALGPGAAGERSLYVLISSLLSSSSAGSGGP